MSTYKIKVKAVGLLSGGLDSALAARVLLDQGIEVHAVHISMPWGCGKPVRVQKIAEALKIPLRVIPLGDDYLGILRAPRHGFGSAFNPCIDCHIYMVQKAAEYMRGIGGDFVFTGEVLGQRPMSQRRQCLDWVEKDGGIEGRLLRPLSAQHLEPTIPETEGIVDRSRLLAIEGRSRKIQLRLARDIGVEGYSQPAGGCLLTHEHFGERLKDVLQRGCQHIDETAILGLGRYFRVSDDVYILLGRDADENERLVEYALPDDRILRPFLFPGPLAVARGKNISDDDLQLAAGLIQYFSKHRHRPAQTVSCWIRHTPDDIREVRAVVPSEDRIHQVWFKDPSSGK